ncbi:hypothetical protein NQL31_003826 [Lotmaria passim]
MRRGSRNDPQEVQFSHEPFGSDEVTAEARHPFAEPKPPEETIDDLVSRLLVSGDQAMDGLPVMTSPELRVIGRAISFAFTKTAGGAKTRLHYTGLVSAVGATTVTLMHVSRYTEADFEAYKERERALAKGELARAAKLKGKEIDNARCSFPGARRCCDDKGKSGLVPHGYSAEGEVGVGRNGQLSSGGDSAALLGMNAAGSLSFVTNAHAEVEMEHAAFLNEERGDHHHFHGTHGIDGDGRMSKEVLAATAAPHTRTARRRILSTVDGSVGPLPYVTFLRKNIHDVAFGRDPANEFYSLFQDPSKQLLDMQYLRMFVRRYLVHTSEGNNPRQVPLYAFVTVRCACPSVDRELVSRVAREELPGLMKADKSIEKERQKQLQEEQQEAERAAAHEGETASLMFGRTGVLCRTRVPHKSLIAGVVLAALTLMAEVYLCVSLSALTDNLIISFLMEGLWFVVAAMLVWVAASVTTIFHAFFMRVPLRDNLTLLMLRAFFCAGGVGGSLMSLVVLVTRMSSVEIHEFMTKQSKDDLCAFYQAHQCTGFYSSCAHRSAATTGDALCRPSCLVHVAYETTCHSAMTSPVQVAFLPMMVFSVLSLFACLYSLFLLIRLLLFAHSAARRRAS